MWHLRLLVVFSLLFVLTWGQIATETGEPYQIFRYYEVTREDQRNARKEKNNILEYLFGDNWYIVARFNRIEPEWVWAGRKLKVPLDMKYAETWSPLPERLTSVYSKSVLIDLKSQALGAYEDGKLQFWMPISAGRKGHSTPKGAYRIMAKDRDHISSIYLDTRGNNSKMPWALMFYVSPGGIAYWIHGGDLPGYPDSHGCVRLFNEDAKKLFLWVSPEGEDGRYVYVKKEIIPVVIR